jgi:myo-inositol-1(or 4)-monophosphatase
MKFDRVAEQAVVESLPQSAAFTLVSEETGVREIGTAPKGFVILDPVDGSLNVSRRLPICCVSAAYASEPVFEAIQVAVVQEIFSGFCFHAVRGLGAFRDNARIRSTPLRRLNQCLVGVDAAFPWQNRPGRGATKSSLGTSHTRHLGSNALELCYVADGTFDAFVDLRDAFRGTDLAAASLILKEAGGVLLSPTGEPLTGRCTHQDRYSFVAASSLQLGRQLLELACPSNVG